jgi:hypothetical protein
LYTGAIVTSAVNKSDDIYAFQNVSTPSIQYIYLNWTNNISASALIENAVLTLEHQENQLNMSVQLFDNNTWKNVCDPADTESDRIDTCDLSYLVNTVQEANQIRIRLKLEKTSACHEKLDLALINITYCTPSISDNLAPNIKLINPPNNTITNQTTINFQYNVTDQNNISFCELIINGTVYQTNHTVTRNITQTFTQILSQGMYHWNVNCTDIYGNEGASQTWNLVIQLPQQANDTTKPNVTLVNPANNSTDSDGQINFVYNVTDSSPISYCMLIINGSVYQTDNTITVNTTNNFNQNLPNGYYLWWVNCTDIYGNTGQSQTWSLWVNITPPNVTLGNATSCCCNLDLTTTPRTAEIGEKVLIVADVNVENTGIPAQPSNITQVNVTVYRVENNTQVLVVNNTPMAYLRDGLWYYSADEGFSVPGNYIASVTMITNQTPSFTKQTSYTFTVKDTGSGLYIQGVSPDLINLNQLTRLAAEVIYNGKPIDANKLTNALLEVEQLNGTINLYNLSNGLIVNNGILYADGLFNGTGVYYLNWTVDYLGEIRSAKEIVVVVDWDNKLSNISVNINDSSIKQVIDLINENKNYLLNLLQSMEFLNQFTQEQVFLVTDSVNSMTDIVNFLQEGKLTPQQAQEQFASLQAKIENELGSKLLGGAVAKIEVKNDKSKTTKILPWLIAALVILIAIIGGVKLARKRAAASGKASNDAGLTKEETAKSSGNIGVKGAGEKLYNILQIPRIKTYSVLTFILLAVLAMLKINNKLTGYVVAHTVSLLPAWNGNIFTSSSLLTIIILSSLIVLLVLGAKKTKMYIEVERKEADDRTKSIQQLIGTGNSSAGKIYGIYKKKKQQKQAEIKGSGTKTKIKVLDRKDDITKGIAPRNFSYHETIFTHNKKNEQETETEDDNNDAIKMPDAYVITDEMKQAIVKAAGAEMASNMTKQEIVNSGLSNYLNKHAEEPADYIQLPVRHRKTKGRVVRIFRLGTKDDFYPILECMRENKHIIIITAGALLEKDPETMKKFAKQLDYVGMVYDARLTALDDRNFAVIPGFARFDP